MLPPPSTHLLDGPPPSPPGAQGGPPPSANYASMTPQRQLPDSTAQMAGRASMILQLGAAISKALSELSQISPELAAVTAQIDALLRGGLNSVLKQGPGSPESPSPPVAPQGMGQLTQSPNVMGGGLEG